jgi:hypothetical protein
MPPFFKKKPKTPELKALTLQDYQQQFNQVMFELGDITYRKHMFNQEIAKLASEANTRIQKADQLGLDAQKLRANIQKELAAKVEEGKEMEKADDAQKAS